MGKFNGILLLSAFITPFLSYGQNGNPNPTIEVAKMQFQSKQVVPPAPEAAELGKYGNVPVSLFTGTPNVSIPLFELKGNSLSLPISLSYNASGYKPEDQATWVGSGWSLNAGGVITRSAMGNPDIETNYFGLPNLLNPPDHLDITPYYAYMKNIQNGVIETQPDVYYYNFAGHSGKFVLRPDMSVVKKEKDLKIITPCISANCPGSKFTIVDEQGVTYVFNQIEETTMIPSDDEGNPNYHTYPFVSSWYLSLMYSADGSDVVEFEYYYNPNLPHVLYQNLLPNKSVSLTYGCKTNPGCQPTPVYSLFGSISLPPTVSITRRFLKKITLKRFGTAVAYAEIESLTGRQDSDFSEDRLVKHVRIYSINNGTGDLVKNYEFSYSYFDTNPNAGSGALRFLNKRLRLDQVQEISLNENANSSPPAYIFTYDPNSSDRFTASLDHWGFYNATGNSSLVPNVYFPGGTQSGGCSISATNVGDGANREASLNGSSATLLNKIQYPTGGYTTFTYELNRAKLADNIVHDVGGVRIKQIIDYSFTNKAAVAKNYTYLLDDGITTSGNIGRWPDYSTNSIYHHYFTPSNTQDCAAANEGTEYELHTISVATNSIFGLGSFQGSHIGYSQVTELMVNLATGEPLGKTIYKYGIGEYFEYEEDIKNGDLIEQNVYNNDNKLLQQTKLIYDYTYNYDIVAQVVKASELQTNKAFYCKRGNNDYVNYGDWEAPPDGCIPDGPQHPTKLYLTNYTIIPQNRQLRQQTTTVFDQLSDSYLTTTKNYTYGNPNHNYPTLIEEITTNEGKIKTAIKYVMDYTGASGTPGTMAGNINYMQQKNMMGIPVEKLQYRQDANGNNTKYISGQLTDYVLGNPSHLYFLEAKPPLTSVTPSSTNGNAFNYDSHYRPAATLTYDELFNLREQSKTNDVITTYIWGYNRQYPVAQVTGADYTTVSSLVNQNILNDPSSTESQIRNELNNIRTGLANTKALVTTSTYRPLIGLSSQTDPNGRTIYYEYDALNRLKLIRDQDGKIIKTFEYKYKEVF